MIVALMSCKAKESNVGTETFDGEIIEFDADFVKFYNDFHSDSIFQMAHVKFPLKKTPMNSGNEYWTTEDWVLHRPFSDHGGKFKRDFNVLGSLIIENIIDANGFFSMERRFAKLSDGWKLIFYNVENPRENAG